VISAEEHPADKYYILNIEYVNLPYPQKVTKAIPFLLFLIRTSNRLNEKDISSGFLCSHNFSLQAKQ